MICLTKCTDWIGGGGYVVLGCELLNEFRRNGSANSIQQKIINPSNGFVWLSEWDYRGLIKPDEVYYIYFGTSCPDCGWSFGAPLFSLEHSYKYVLKTVHQDPFPNAVPEIRDKHRVDITFVDTVYVPMGVDNVYSPTYCVYDGFKK